MGNAKTATIKGLTYGFGRFFGAAVTVPAQVSEDHAVEAIVEISGTLTRDGKKLKTLEQDFTVYGDFVLEVQNHFDMLVEQGLQKSDFAYISKVTRKEVIKDDAGKNTGETRDMADKKGKPITFQIGTLYTTVGTTRLRLDVINPLGKAPRLKMKRRNKKGYMNDTGITCYSGGVVANVRRFLTSNKIKWVLTDLSQKKEIEEETNDGGDQFA